MGSAKVPHWYKGKQSKCPASHASTDSPRIAARQASAKGTSDPAGGTKTVPGGHASAQAVPPFKLSLEEENATLKRQVTCLTKRLGAAEAEIALREECRQLLKELFKEKCGELDAALARGDILERLLQKREADAKPAALQATAPPAATPGPAAGGAAAPPAHKTAPAAALQRSAAHPPTPKTLPAQQQPAIPVSAPPKPAAEPAAPPSAPKTASTIAAPGQTLKAPKDVQQAAPKPTPPAGSTSSAAEPAPTQEVLPSEVLVLVVGGMLPERKADARAWDDAAQALLEEVVGPWSCGYEALYGTVQDFLRRFPQLFPRRPDGAFFSPGTPSAAAPAAPPTGAADGGEKKKKKQRQRGKK